MASRLESLPPSVRRVASALRTTGWISFWGQLIPGVIATAVILFAGTTLSIASTRRNPETGLGFFFATCALLALLASVYWAYRYTRVSRQLSTAESGRRPQPGDVLRTLRIGLFLNLAGMLLSIFGAQAISGALLAKAFVQPQGINIYTPQAVGQFIQPLDMYLVQANTNIIMAHFIGLVATLWLQQIIVGRKP